MMTHVVGIDPGLVHTGVVNMMFNTAKHEITVLDVVVQGPDPDEVKKAIALCGVKPIIFIEDFNSRSHYNQDKRMIQAVSEIHKALPGSRVLSNVGVKKVVHRKLMELLGVWDFASPTHHQDLRSAARIGILGMLKAEPLNQLISDIVRDHLHGKTWTVA